MGEQNKAPEENGAESGWTEEELLGKDVDPDTMNAWDRAEERLKDAEDTRLISPELEADVNDLKQRLGPESVDIDVEAICKVYPQEEGIGYEVRERTVFDGKVKVFREKGEKRHNDDILEEEVYIDWNGPVVGLRNLEKKERDEVLADVFRSDRLQQGLQNKGYASENLDINVHDSGKGPSRLSISFDLADTESIWAKNDLTQVKQTGAVGYVEHEIRQDVYEILEQAVKHYGERMTDEIDELELLYAGGEESYGQAIFSDPLELYEELSEQQQEERLNMVEGYLADQAVYRRALVETQ